MGVNIKKLDRSKILDLLSYGDIKKIAEMTEYHYQHVSRVIRQKRDNDAIWRAAVEYLDSHNVNVSDRLAEVLNEHAA